VLSVLASGCGEPHEAKRARWLAECTALVNEAYPKEYSDWKRNEGWRLHDGAREGWAVTRNQRVKSVTDTLLQGLTT